MHLSGVAQAAAGFADLFGWESAAWIAGLLHDIGKMCSEFQSYIAEPKEAGLITRRPGHNWPYDTTDRISAGN